MIDIDSISGVRIAIFAPEKDERCPFEPFKNVKTEFTKIMPGIPHDYFNEHKGEEFVKELIAQLWIAPGDEEHSDEL